MKTNYTVPTLSSLEDHGIKDLISVGNYEEELRLVQLTGIPVRIRIDKDYVELNSTENEINLSAYKECFIKLMKFFYGVGYVYGYMNGNKLTVYDIYTNDNFFSTRDLNIVEKETGLPVVKPIFEGNFTFDFIISVLNKKINDEKIPADELFILPSVYINDGREWVTAKTKEISTVIYGKKPEPKTYPNNYGHWDNVLQCWVYPKEEKKEEKEKTTAKNHNQYEVFQFSTKEERTEIFNETYKNVSKYVEKNKSTFTKPCLEWWEKYGKYITYFYSIHTLPVTRMILWEYSELYCISYIDRYLSITEKWADFFAEFFEDTYGELMKKKIKFDYNFTLFFEKVFHDELLELDKFYVQENPKSSDWRYGINTLSDLEEGDVF
jgi:hypothetical protein